jgi:hypothetical protein
VVTDRRARGQLALLALASFAAAFLSFGVQPLLAKWLLPALGGSPGTWASCMVFFQGMLVFGYLAAALAASRPVLYAALALSALASALFRLPLTAASDALPSEALESGPAWYVLGLLLSRVGLPFLVLATVAPLVQRWAAELATERVHRLYAVSNAGSLAALLAYPSLIEPSLELATQWRLWSIATAALCALLIGLSLAPRAAQSIVRSPAVPEAPSRLTAAQRMRWIAYAAVPCALLIATTSYLTTDIAAVPLLWVVPLSLYLLTFIAAFGGAGARTERVALVLFLLSSAGIGWNALEQGSAPLWRQLTFSLATLGSASLLCHLELVRTRPGVASLTEFYVWIAAGGALGSMFVAFLAPAIFADYYELEVAVLATYVGLIARPRRVLSAFEGGPLRRSLERPLLWLAFGLCAPMLVFTVWLRAHGGTTEGRIIDRRRSFLGAIRVTELSVGRILTHGRIRHGMQLLDPALRRMPTMYYGEGTGIARVFERHRAGSARRIGVIGLGAGTIAALGTKTDRIRFYELDAQVIDVARTRFSFLRESAAETETQLGDGRISLARDPEMGFDILVLDAFASDAVPVHLLTLEAFGLYLRQLAPDGVLLLNVANRHLAVDRVVRGAARAYGLACVVVETPANPERFVSRVRWAVIARRGEQVSHLVDGMDFLIDPLPGVVWTDAHASVWSVLR